MSTYHTAGGKTYTLSGSISSTATTIILTSFLEPVTDTPYTMALLNTDIAYGTISPKTSSSEFISFTGITQNADGTATLSGVVRGLAKKYPFTTDSAYKLPHSGQSQFILSDVPQVFQQYVPLNNDVTVAGVKTFSSFPVTPSSSPTTDYQVANKKYVDDIAISGSPDSSTTVKGIGKVSVAPASATSPIFVGDNDNRVSPVSLASVTSGRVAALAGDNTDIAIGAGNLYVSQTGLQKQAECYAASSAGSDTYAITLSPVPISYTNGMRLRFKTDVANTGAATLNVNGLGAISLVTGLSTALATGDILANQVVEVVYNSTGPVFEVLNPASMVVVNPTAAILAVVPNTNETSNVWYSWTQPFISATLSGPTETLLGFTNSFTVGTNGKGGFGNKELSGSASVVFSDKLPGNGSNTYYTAVSSKDIKFKWRMMQSVSGSGDYLGYGFADAIATLDDVETSIATGIRFVNNNGVIFASNGDGAANTNTNVDSGITDANYNTYEIVFDPGVNAKFYINGTLVATHTTNLPTGSLQFFGMGYTKGTNSVTVYLNPITLSLEQ